MLKRTDPQSAACHPGRLVITPVAISPRRPGLQRLPPASLIFAFTSNSGPTGKYPSMFPGPITEVIYVLIPVIPPAASPRQQPPSRPTYIPSLLPTLRLSCSLASLESLQTQAMGLTPLLQSQLWLSSLCFFSSKWPSFTSATYTQVLAQNLPCSKYSAMPAFSSLGQPQFTICP